MLNLNNINTSKSLNALLILALDDLIFGPPKTF